MKHLYLTFILFSSIVFAQDCEKGFLIDYKPIDRSKPMVSENDIISDFKIIKDENGEIRFLFHPDKANYHDVSRGYKIRFDNGYIIRKPNNNLLFENKSFRIFNDLNIYDGTFRNFEYSYVLGDLNIHIKDFYNTIKSFEGDFKCVAEIDEIYNNEITRKIIIWENGVIWEQGYGSRIYKNTGLYESYVFSHTYYSPENQTPLISFNFGDKEGLTNQQYQFLKYSENVEIFNSKGCMTLKMIPLNEEITYLMIYNPIDASFKSTKIHTFFEDTYFKQLGYSLIPTTVMLNGIDENNLMYNMIEELEKIDTYNLIEFYNIFIKLLNKKNIFLKNKTNNAEIFFESLSEGSLAEAHAMHDDNLVLIKVDPNEWKKSSIQKKSYIMFHELFHDVFNLRHGQGGKMMFCFAEKDYDWYNFIYDTNKLLSFLKSNHGISRLNNYYYE